MHRISIYVNILLFCASIFRTIEEQQVVFKYYDEPVQFTKSKSTRGGQLLVSSYGYSYNLRREVPQNRETQWRCSVRNKKIQCTASVTERNGSYFQTNRHIHLPKAGLKTKVEVTAEVSVYRQY